MADNGNDGAAMRSQSSRLALSEINLVDVIRDVWGGKYVIIVLAVLGIFYAIVSLSMAKPIYTATVMVGPSENSNTHSVSSLGKYAAGALGISLGGSDSSYFSKYKETLDSNLLAEALFKRKDLRPLFYGPGWDPKTGTFKRPTGLVFEIKEFIKGILGLHTWATPDPFGLREVLKRQMAVTSNKVTGFVEITMQAERPDEALHLLQVVITEADSLLRNYAKQRSAGRIDYLSQALVHTTIQDQREAMVTILSAQQRNLMMASVDKTFAMEIIDPPSVSSVPTSPRPRAVLAMKLLVMVLIGIFGAVIYGQRMRWSKKDRHFPVKSFDEAAWDFVRAWSQKVAVLRRFNMPPFRQG